MKIFGKPVTIRQAIRIAMVMNDVTGYELADMAQLHYLTISKYSSKNTENGKLTIDTIEKIVDALGIEREEFWKVVEDKSELADMSKKILNLKGKKRNYDTARKN